MNGLFAHIPRRLDSISSTLLLRGRHLFSSKRAKAGSFNRESTCKGRELYRQSDSMAWNLCSGEWESSRLTSWWPISLQRTGTNYSAEMSREDILYKVEAFAWHPCHSSFVAIRVKVHTANNLRGFFCITSLDNMSLFKLVLNRTFNS